MNSFDWRAPTKRRLIAALSYGMCGRFSNHTPAQIYGKIFRAGGPFPEVSRRYNIAPPPTDEVLTCRQTNDGRRLVLFRWGLVPYWAKDTKIGYSTINARAETVATKPAFRDAFRRRRCLIAADGFYEWQDAKPRKQPYHIRLRGGEPFAFGGLWERWQAEGQEPLYSCTLIVTEPNRLVAPLHPGHTTARAIRPLALSEDRRSRTTDAATKALLRRQNGGVSG